MSEEKRISDETLDRAVEAAAIDLYSGPDWPFLKDTQREGYRKHVRPIVKAAISALQATPPDGRRLRSEAESLLMALLEILPVEGSWEAGYAVSPRIASEVRATEEEWATAAHHLCGLQAALCSEAVGRRDSTPLGGDERRLLREALRGAATTLHYSPAGHTGDFWTCMEPGCREVNAVLASTQPSDGRISVELTEEEAKHALDMLCAAHGYFEPEKCATCRAEEKLRAALTHNPQGAGS